MTNIIFGNILSFIGSAFLIMSTFCKSKKKLMLFQSINAFICAVGNIFLKGYSGLVVNLIAGIKNLMVYFDRMTKTITYIIVILVCILGVMFNNRGFIGILPIIATVEYSIIVCKKDSTTQDIKVALSINVLLWIAYNIYCIDIVGAVIHTVLLVTTLWNLLKDKQYK